MARECYIGIDGIARKIKRGYVGVSVNTNIAITSDNLSRFFAVVVDDYYFTYDGSTFTSNNGGKANTTAWTALRARCNMSVSFSYSYSSEPGWDKFYLTVADNKIEDGVSGATTIKSWSGTLKEGQMIQFAYSKDGSVNGNDDKCTLFNINITAVDMAKFIKRAYIGVGGVARPCWSGGEVQRYGQIEELSPARRPMAATTVKNYALFAGGSTTSTTMGISTTTRYNNIDVYDATLTHTTPITLSQKKYLGTASTVGNYAVVAGGSLAVGNSAVVDAYSSSLVQASGIDKLSSTKNSLASASVGDYVLFAGGSVTAGYAKDIDVYRSSLTKESSSIQLSSARSGLVATTLGSYAFFAGGAQSGSSSSDTVDVYDAHLSQIANVSSMRHGRRELASTTIGKYSLFAGNYSSDQQTISTIDAYNSSLTRQSVEALTHGGAYLLATTVGGYALFAGGFDASNSKHSKVVDAYDISLTKQQLNDLSDFIVQGAATTVGYYALFAGGSGFVDAYSV